MSTRWAVSRATSRALVAAAAVVATMLPLPSAAASRAAAAPAQSACGGRLQVPDGVDNPELNGSVPVVLVHGISSSADLWDTEAADGGPNLAQTVADMDQASVWAFDYGDAALDWVTDPRIGPALADAVRCLHEQSGNHVVLVGHSMGGLAIQHAVAHGGLEQAVAHVSTIATPFEGSMSLTMVNRFLDPDAPGPLPASWRLIARVLLDKCAQLNQAAAAGDLWAICGPAGIPNSPVGRALMVGSEEIGALPPWPASVPTFRVAGSM
jgi:triacylglycerol lipase